MYVNQQLVGYSLIAETAYDCDVAKALKPGQRNLIAIRVTNPGGNYDWYDPGTLTWGKYTFHAGRGVGGLDRGLTLRAHDSVHLSDIPVPVGLPFAPGGRVRKVAGANGKRRKATRTVDCGNWRWPWRRELIHNLGETLSEVIHNLGVAHAPKLGTQREFRPQLMNNFGATIRTRTSIWLRLCGESPFGVDYAAAALA